MFDDLFIFLNLIKKRDLVYFLLIDTSSKWAYFDLIAKNPLLTLE